MVTAHQRNQILKYHAHGVDIYETARQLGVPARLVMAVINNATPRQKKAAQQSPMFTEPRLF